MNHRQPSACHICGEMCASKIKLRRHIRRLHTHGVKGVKLYEHTDTVPERQYVAARDFFDAVRKVSELIKERDALRKELEQYTNPEGKEMNDV